MTESTKSQIKTYKDLLVWQKAMDLLVLGYKLAVRLPAIETYGLASQIRRAAVSIPANIAEGHGRRHRGDFLRSLSFASGSLRELETHFQAIVRLNYLPERDLNAAFSQTDEIGRMLAGLMKKLRAKN
jgi:four helix bundle protein